MPQRGPAGPRSRDERDDAGVVLTVERGDRGDPARLGLGRAVEPEADVERVGRRQVLVRIEAEDLVEQDRLDLHRCRTRRVVSMSDWYQARPKLPLKFGSGVPLARCGLPCVGDTGNEAA